MGCNLVTICDDISCETSKIRLAIGFYRAWSFSIGECTRAQLDAISQAMAELQAKEPRQKARRRIGFIQDENK